MKRVCIPWLLGFFAAIVPVAALQVIDGTGTLVNVPDAPRAVVSLTLMTDEFLSELLPPNRIRAYSRSADDPVLSNIVESAKLVKGRAWLNLEALVALNPDLIVAADWSDAGELGFLRQKGYAVYVVKTPRSWTQVKDRLAALGKALSADDRAQSVLQRLVQQERDLAAVRARVTTPVSVLEYNSFGSSMSSGTIWDDLCTLAGVKNLSAGLSVDDYGYAPLSRELLVRLDPQWLVLPSQGALTSYGQGDFLKALQADPLYQRLQAVRRGQILFLPESLKTSTSQAALGAALTLQHAAYPNLR